MKVRSVFLALRQQGRPLIVLQVRSFDFFRLGLAEVYSAAPVLAHLKGRQFQSLGQAAQEIHIELFGRGSGYSNYMREYEAYCIGRFDEAWTAHLGKGTRIVVSHGEEFEQPFSPDLLNTYVELAPDSLAPGGRWVACCDLLPLVPLGVSDAEASARLARELEQNRHHPTVGSRNRRPGSSSTHAAASSRSSTHATQSSSSRSDGRGDWRSGREQTSGTPAGERYRSPAHESEHAQAPIERAPKRARFSTKDGLCVYRLVGDTDTPHEIVSHWLVEQAVPGQPGMKMLKLRPLYPPGAGTLDVPYVETVPLNDRFKIAWRAVWDADRDGRTGRTDFNGGIYDAHIRAVKLQAKIAKQSERDMFHQLRWGRGKLAFAPPPPELEAT